MRAEIAIIGAGGGVGSSVAFNLLLQEGQYDIAMVDGRSGMARSHEMDLQQVVAAGAAGSVRIVGLDEALDSHIVVITASEPLTVNRSRRVYLHGNAEVVRTVTEGIRAQGDWPGIVLLVTNPVDVLLTWCIGSAGWTATACWAIPPTILCASARRSQTSSRCPRTRSMPGSSASTGTAASP